MGQKITFSGDADTRSRVEARAFSTRSEVPGVELVLQVPGLEIESAADGFSAVSVPGLEPVDIAGAPELFATGSLIAVPEGFEPELTLTETEIREIPGVVVRPAQQKFRCGGQSVAFQFNSALYRSRTTFPASWAEIQEVGRLQGLKLARVAFHPVRMNFIEKTLVVAPKLVAQVTFRKTTDAAPVVLSKAFHLMARNVVANSASFSRIARTEDAPELMLVVTADSLKDSIAPFVQWKRAKGLDVQVATFTEAGGTKEAVKEYVQKIYDQRKPTYLLFVGNKTTMPSFFESTASGSAASDYRYALLSGGDLIPDAYYGRIVADTADEVTLQVNRWIEYERSPEAGAAWYPNGTTIASNEGSNPSDKEYAQQIQAALKAYTYKQVDGFFQGEQTATAANISGAVNSGRSWIAYFGHGSGTSWGSTNDAFGNTQVAKLANQGRLPVIIDVACQNGSWANLSKCFGKAWVTHTASGKHAGAVAFYGGSVNISWHPPAVMSVGVAKYHFEKPVRTLGGSVLAGQLYLIEKMGNTSSTIDNLEWYNLFGDPSMLIRTDVPKAYDVKHDVMEDIDGRTVEVTVVATDNSGNGVEGLLASVAAGNGTTLAVGKTNASGHAVLVVSGVGGLEPNSVLTTTGYNAETRQTVIH